MRGEILTLETAEKLARIKTVHNYINEKLKGAYTKYNLSADAVICLQCIDALLKGAKWKD